jgi:hypothetical protein
MATSLFEFVWRAPAHEDGYVLGDVRGEPGLVVRPERPFREYHPYQEYEGLFRIFADTPTTPEGCLTFANRFGLLHSRSTPDERGKYRAEELGDWYVRVRQLRYLVTLWELARARDRTGLAEFIEWKGDDIHLLGGAYDGDIIWTRRRFYFAGGRSGRPKEAGKFLMDPRMGPEHTLAGWHVAPRAGHPPRPGFAEPLRPGDLVAPANAYVQFVLSRIIPMYVFPWVVWDATLGRLAFQVAPANLWCAVCLQFALAVDGDKRYQRCPVCARWFELAPGVNRANRLTCSSTCRTRAYRDRREAALRLHAEGSTPREIARQLGSDVPTVKKWIANAKE